MTNILGKIRHKTKKGSDHHTFSNRNDALSDNRMNGGIDSESQIDFRTNKNEVLVSKLKIKDLLKMIINADGIFKAENPDISLGLAMRCMKSESEASQCYSYIKEKMTKNKSFKSEKILRQTLSVVILMNHFYILGFEFVRDLIQIAAERSHISAPPSFFDRIMSISNEKNKPLLYFEILKYAFHLKRMYKEKNYYTINRVWYFLEFNRLYGFDIGEIVEINDPYRLTCDRLKVKDHRGMIFDVETEIIPRFRVIYENMLNKAKRFALDAENIPSAIANCLLDQDQMIKSYDSLTKYKTISFPNDYFGSQMYNTKNNKTRSSTTNNNQSSKNVTNSSELKKSTKIDTNENRLNPESKIQDSLPLGEKKQASIKKVERPNFRRKSIMSFRKNRNKSLYKSEISNSSEPNARERSRDLSKSYNPHINNENNKHSTTKQKKTTSDTKLEKEKLQNIFSSKQDIKKSSDIDPQRNKSNNTKNELPYSDENSKIKEKENKMQDKPAMYKIKPRKKDNKKNDKSDMVQFNICEKHDVIPKTHQLSNKKDPENFDNHDDQLLILNSLDQDINNWLEE